MITGKKIGVISLGCDKNRVDTEKMLYTLSERHTLVNDINSAEIVIINTCAFIESAREESVNEILTTAELKKDGVLEKLIVTGCLPQKYKKELYDELTEVDAFLGVSDYSEINGVIDKIYSGERVFSVGEPKGECTNKRITTTNGYAYLKIADGCSNHCTYCTIPSIRGSFRSVPKDFLLEEAKNFKNGTEVILVAQDVTKYGEDLNPKTNLVELIRSLSVLSNVKGIRLLYCYPENITDELIKEMRENAKVIRYIDIPFQHASDKVLKLMGRKGRGEDYLNLVERLKREVPGIAVRSTFITGFPGETEEDVDTLIEFLKKAKLFNAGFFKYSREEGTPAYKLPEQVPEKDKGKRIRKLYSTQKKVVKENLSSFVGKTFKVFSEGFDEEQLVYYGRAYFNAPDIDGKIYFFSDEEIEYGVYYDVKILKASGYDLYGEKL